MSSLEKILMIAIAGGSGYVGRYLAEALSVRNDILILDRCAPDFPLGGNIRFVETDLAEEDPSEYMAGVDTVLHLAAESDVRRTESSYHDTYLTTRSIVDAMGVCGIGRLLFFSSSAVYGSNGWDADEDTECVPASEYARDKIRSESLILGTEGIQSAVLRFSNICGGAVRHGVVYDFCRKLERDPSYLEVLGNGRQTKEFLHIRDCIRAVEHTLDAGLEGVFNIGNGDPVSVNDVASEVISAMGLRDVNVSATGGETGWKGDVARCRLDSSRFSSTGWKPSAGSLEAVRDAVRECTSIDGRGAN